MASNIEKSNLAPQLVVAVEGSVEYDIDPEEDRKVLRKIDWVVMPTMMIVLFFQCKTAFTHHRTSAWSIVTDELDIDLDKQSINYATVFGMNRDLRLTGSAFSWVITLFYFGQFASEYMSAYFIGRFQVVRVVGITV